jgi:hypothetical protein
MYISGVRSEAGEDMDDRVGTANAELAPSLLTAEAVRTLADALGTWRTVDRRQVHKAAVSEVFATDLCQIAPDRYAVAVQWPRWHPFFRPRPAGSLHPLLFVESLRQGGILLTHQFLGVPLGHQFVFQAIGAQYLTPSEPRPPVAAAAGPIILALSVRTTGQRTRGASLHLDVEGWYGSVRFAVATATYRSVSAAAYARLRAGRAATSVQAGLPVKGRSADQSAEAVPRHEYLRVDYDHPTFFDHAVDHLPGLLLMEAALTAAGVDAPDTWRQLRSFHLSFHRYAELHEPTLLTACPSGEGDDRQINVTIEQAEQMIASGTVTLADGDDSR